MIPNKIILHHSATKDSGTVSWNAIRRYHVNECAWADIGYHFGVEFITDTGSEQGSYEILAGRMLDQNGAHTTGQNGQAIGVCFVGNYDEVTPPKRMLEQGVKLCAWLCRAFNINPMQIYGHRQFARKTCPGSLFDVEKFKQDVARLA